MANEDERHPWERREGESVKAFTAFCVYRDMGVTRSMDRAYREAKGKQTGRASGRWREWIAKFDWTKRAEEYDLYLELQARQKREAEHHAELEAYRNRQKQLAQATTNSALRALQLANAKLTDLQKNYDEWKTRLSQAKTDDERAQILKQDPINLMSIPNWLRAAASVSQVAGDAESQALAVGELLGVLEDTKK